MKFVIYKITNLINGKIYIGKTKRFSIRTNQHLNSKRSVIGRALAKYGKENFSFEEIFVADSEEELSKKEIEYIKMYNSVVPYGYNVVSHECSKIIIHKDTIKKIRINNSKQNSSGFHGVYVYPNRNIISCKFKHNQRRYEKTFESIEKAAEFYDMFMLFEFGEDAIINFPDKVDMYYENIEYKEMYFFINSPQYTGEYKGVSWNKAAKKWAARIHIKGKQICLGFYKFKKAAALIRDAAVLHLGANLKLNFDFLKNKLKPCKAKYLYEKFSYIKDKKDVGISLSSKTKKWMAYIGAGKAGKYTFLGWFNKKEDAASARETALKRKIDI